MRVTTTAIELRISDRSASFDRFIEGPREGRTEAYRL
jgi:hypothetical protein